MSKKNKVKETQSEVQEIQPAQVPSEPTVQESITPVEDTTESEPEQLESTQDTEQTPEQPVDDIQAENSSTQESPDTDSNQESEQVSEETTPQEPEVTPEPDSDEPDTEVAENTEPEVTIPEEEDDKEEKSLFVSDNGVMPAVVYSGGQFVVGLSRKLTIGTKIKSGTKTFIVDWANDAHKSTLDGRRNAHQTLLRLESRSGKPLTTSEYFSEKAEFEIL